ncbi:MAG: hypothetical protein ABIU05_09405 [Nitrospirales bacterium]
MAHMPDRGQRPGAAANLVRGTGLLGSEHGRVLQMAELVEEQEDTAGGHVHVKGIPPLDFETG